MTTQTVEAYDPNEQIRSQQRDALRAPELLGTGNTVNDAPKVSPGLDASSPTIIDYWTGPPSEIKWFFPDGVQYISFLPMNHGMRARFSASTNKELTLDRKSGNAKIKTDISGDTDVLIEISVTGWHVMRGGVPQPFSKAGPGSSLFQFLQQADPALVDSLEKAIRKANPWMDSEVTIEQIDEQIEELTTLRKERELEAQKK